MIIKNINGGLTPTAECDRFKLLVKTENGSDTYEICDAGDGELIIRNLTSPTIAIRPKADNAVSIIRSWSK